MIPLTTAIVTLVLTFGAAWAAMTIRSFLPESHVSKESQDVVRLGMGLVATMTALLLGLVTAAAKSTFDSHDAAIRASAVNVLTLDRHLARYGPEAQPIRDQLRRAVEIRARAMGATPGSRGLGTGPENTALAEEIQDRLLALSPATDAQRWFRTESLKLTDEVVKMRWRTISSQSGAVSRPLLTVVIFWLTVTFASFGLFAPRNATVQAVLLLVALSVSAAVFLILELDGPFSGLIRVSGEPVRYALTILGR